MRQVGCFSPRGEPVTEARLYRAVGTSLFDNEPELDEGRAQRHGYGEAGDVSDMPEGLHLERLDFHPSHERRSAVGRSRLPCMLEPCRRL